MNDAAVREIWKRLEKLEDAVEMCEDRINFLEGQVRARLNAMDARIRARLKEKAERRKLGVTPPDWTDPGLR